MLTSPLREALSNDVLAPGSQLFRMLDRHAMLDPFELRKGRSTNQSQSTAQPLVRETATAYQIAVAAPGMKPEDISVTIDQGVLRVHGESKVERNGWVQHHHVDRAVQLPPSMIDADTIEATHDNGLLSITVPKKGVPEPRRIAVRAGSPKAVPGGSASGTEAAKDTSSQ